jgi:RNA polymerase sigma factor (sigma-70 family)
LYKEKAVNNLGLDKDLLEGLKLQDKNCIEKIYRQNFQMVQTLILNNRGSSDDAADIFQETMIVLYEKSINPSFELSCQLKTYIYSVARRLWLKKLQQQQRIGLQTDDFEQVIPIEDDVEDHQKQQDSFTIMEKSMAKIGEPCKSLLEAFYINKKQMQEIALEFKYTNADNAKTQKYKCLVRLKKIFFAEYKY